MEKEDLVGRIRGGLIVSCQALPEEPLHSPLIMSRMALAAQQGGARGIRANSLADIQAIRMLVDLPMIGIIKQVYPGPAANVYITPTLDEVGRLAACGVEVIAVDATDRPRPGGLGLDQFYLAIRRRHPGQLLMADCATFAEGLHAAELGFDLIGTTLAGYTENTRGTELPDFPLIKQLAGAGLAVIAEGGIWTPGQFRQAIELGAAAAVVGSAITRPQEITRRYVQAMQPD